jgi:hypothetical protein
VEVVLSLSPVTIVVWNGLDGWSALLSIDESAIVCMPSSSCRAAVETAHQAFFLPLSGQSRYFFLVVVLG